MLLRAGKKKLKVSKKSISPTEETISARKAVVLLSFARGELMEE